MSTDDEIKKSTALTPINAGPTGIDLEDDSDDVRGGKFIAFNGAVQPPFHYRKDPATLDLEPWWLVNMHKEIDRWGVGDDAKKIVERIYKTAPGQDLAALTEQLNSEVSPKDYVDSPYGRKPPHVLNYYFGFVHGRTGEQVILANSTAGQKQAYLDLKARIKNKCRLDQGSFVPAVRFDVATMPSNYGPRPRPDFVPIDWRNLSGDQAPAIAPPTLVNPQLPSAAAPKPSAAEIVNDSIDDTSPAPKPVAKPRAGKAKKPEPVAAQGPSDNIEDLW